LPRCMIPQHTHCRSIVMIKWKSSNKRKAGEAHIDCIRAAILSLRSLLFELLAIYFSLLFELLAIYLTIIVIFSTASPRIMYFSRPDVNYEDADLSPVSVDHGEINFTKTLSHCWAVRWLMILRTMMPLNAGSKALKVPSLQFESNFFGAIEIKSPHKKTAYEGRILSILLYFSETWSLTEHQQSRVQLFHNSWVLAMCKVSMWHVQECTRSLKPILSNDFFLSHFNSI
jgi:hypothetical protein